MIRMIVLLLIWAAPAVAAERNRLSEDLRLFVRTDGSDHSPCLKNTPEGACRTWQRAVNIALDEYDLNGHDLIIQAEHGVYHENVLVTGRQVGRGRLILRGDVRDPAAVTLRASDTVLWVEDHAFAYVEGIRIEGEGKLATIGLRVNRRAVVVINGPLDFGPGTNIQMSCGGGGSWVYRSGYRISAGADVHLLVSSGCTHSAEPPTPERPMVIEVVGKPHFKRAFAHTQHNGTINFRNSPITGEASGRRFIAELNGSIHTGAGPNAATYFPGDVDGKVSSGGVFQ